MAGHEKLLRLSGRDADGPWGSSYLAGANKKRQINEVYGQLLLYSFLNLHFPETSRQIKDSAWLIIYPSAYPASLFIFFSCLRGKINLFIFWFLSHSPTEAILVTIGSHVPFNSGFFIKKKRESEQKEAGWSDWEGLPGRGCSSRPWPALKCVLLQRIFSYCHRVSSLLICSRFMLHC